MAFNASNNKSCCGAGRPTYTMSPPPHANLNAERPQRAVAPSRGVASRVARPMTTLSTDYDILAKAIVIGNSSVGKSSLLYRYTEQDWNPHYIATIGVDFKVMTFERDGKIVKLQLWDTAGQDRFRTIVNSYYRGAHGVMIVFALDDRESFDQLQEWLGDVDRFASEGVPVVLVGNKADCNPNSIAVSDEEAEAFAARIGAPYIKTSARENINVDLAFSTTLERCIDHRMALAAKSTATGAGVRVVHYAPEKVKSSKTCAC